MAGDYVGAVAMPFVLIPQSAYTGDPRIDQAMVLAAGVPDDRPVTVTVEGENVRVEWEE
jgi:hypothetical protein